LERSPNFIFVFFVHFVVFFPIFDAMKCQALASPATQSGEESKPRNTLNARKNVEASRAT
jgi:hypothetical protein